MSDLIQITETGFQQGDQAIDWDSDHSARTEHIVPASNRRRILDREHKNGVAPGEDGRLVMAVGAGYRGSRSWQRIWWEPVPHNDTQDLDGEE